ncbi:hypothetical protein Tel_14110 [Candidatus Tenderia electrophaga]|jgi:fructosamine-3-kinase|uniref:Fructosamine kinase n=1 Tax=Candidatus Tenderia electrophaga TaxID=1748243 RepID=A0A0S2TGE2_9GAMM|nr:hypothetical protein Tel_14110 [Candidatus Tenderia electrophaga]
MSLWTDIADDISAATGEPFHCREQQAGGGGCINTTSTVRDGERSYFVKLNRAELADMFEAEAAGLNEIAASESIRVPAVICSGVSGEQSYLVLEQLSLGQGNTTSHEQLGHDLAEMHRGYAEHYGWHRDNTIGSTPQRNTPSKDWVNFWREQRLRFQLRLAAGNGHGGRLQQLGDQLLPNMEAFFAGHIPSAALLHGDLWSGNYAFLADGTPVIFDPAVYYGDRETDLAMTELFGGFNARFYQAYEEAYPLESGYELRKKLYNLYHVLNHLNLFGGGYLSQAEALMGQLLAEIH